MFALYAWRSLFFWGGEVKDILGGVGFSSELDVYLIFWGAPFFRGVSYLPLCCSESQCPSLACIEARARRARHTNCDRERDLTRQTRRFGGTVM